MAHAPPSDFQKLAELEEEQNKIRDILFFQSIHGVSQSNTFGQGRKSTALGSKLGNESWFPLEAAITDIDLNDIATGVFDKLNLQSIANVVVGPVGTLILKTIQHIANGKIFSITPGTGRTLEIRPGGNIEVASTITLTDKDMVFMQYFTDTGKAKVVSSGGGGGSQTPWLSDVDAAEFLLKKLGGLRFSETFGAGTPNFNNLFTNTLNSWLVIQTKSSDFLALMQGDNVTTDRYASLSKGLQDFSLILGAEFRVQALRVKDISNFDEDMVLRTDLGGLPKPTFSISALIVDADQGGDLGKRLIPWNNLNIEQIRLRAGEVIIDIPSITTQGNDMILNVNTGDKLEVRVLNTSIGSWGASLFEVKSAQINLGDSTADGIGLIGQITSSFIPKFSNAIDVGRNDRRIARMYVGNRMRIPTGTNLFD